MLNIYFKSIWHKSYYTQETITCPATQTSTSNFAVPLKHQPQSQKTWADRQPHDTAFLWLSRAELTTESCTHPPSIQAHVFTVRMKMSSNSLSIWSPCPVSDSLNQSLAFTLVFSNVALTGYSNPKFTSELHNTHAQRVEFQEEDTAWLLLLLTIRPIGFFEHQLKAGDPSRSIGCSPSIIRCESWSEIPFSYHWKQKELFPWLAIKRRDSQKKKIKNK